MTALQAGRAIPAHPLALDGGGRFDERRQRALTRYYVAAGAGGLAVGVHTTQFAIRDPTIGLFEPLEEGQVDQRLVEPVLAIAREEMDRADAGRSEPLIRVGGICGTTDQALREADLLVRLGYHVGLLSLAALKDSDDSALLSHCEAIAARIPVAGFYLQPSVGGRRLSYAFWRRFAEIPAVVAIKIAPFNRYQTLDVVRAVVDAGRDDIALYTGNDDAIVSDLVTTFRFARDGLSAASWGSGRCGRAAPWRCSMSVTPQRAHRRCRPACCGEASRSRMPTQRSSTPRTVSPAASRAFKRSCVVRDCWQA